MKHRHKTTPYDSTDAQLLRQHRVFLFLISLAASTILVKLADIQILELIFFAYTPILLLDIARQRFVLTLNPISRNLAIHYLVFTVVTTVLAIASLRLHFYPPTEIGLFKRPILVSIARLVELALAFFFLLFLYDLFRKSRLALRFCMRCFFACGVIGAIYSILSIPLSLATGLTFGLSEGSIRMRGFFNEGGPYGIYLICVFLVGAYLNKQGWITKITWNLSLVFLTIAFLGSQSKAAFSAVIVLILIGTFVTSKLSLRISILAILAIATLTATYVFDLPSKIWLYVAASEQYELLAARNPEDTNLVVGRVAGLVIVPRMTVAHPLIGVGFGNYGLMRNDPDYRGRAPYVRWFDAPGLGLLGYAAEFGIPLLLYFMYVLAKPFFYARSRDSSHIVQTLAIYPLISALFGTQLNIYYPWLIAAFALAAASPVISYDEPSNSPV